MNDRLAFELRIPGTWLTLPDRDAAWEVSGQIATVVSAFDEASLALIRFEQYQQRARPTDTHETWEAQAERKTQIRRHLEHEAAQGMRQFSDPAELYAEVARLDMIEAFHRGELPRQIAHHEPFMYAKAFLYAADTIDKVLSKLAEHPALLDEAKEACLAFKDVLPHLREVRNSAQHIEDRARGMGRGGKALELKPIDNAMIKAPGGALVLNSLNGNRYGSTMADGHYGEVEVSASTLSAMRDAIEAVVNAMQWRGPVDRRPR